MMKYKEERTLTISDLRNACIANNWYTMGNNEEYVELLNMPYDENGCLKHMDVNELYKVAENIWLHSEELNYTVDCIMCELATNYCTTHFYKVF